MCSFSCYIRRPSKTFNKFFHLLSLFLLLQEHWNVRSKGLLLDFANGQLGRVRAARARAYSGTGDCTDDEDNDYDMIRGTHISSFSPLSMYIGCKHPLHAFICRRGQGLVSRALHNMCRLMTWESFFRSSIIRSPQFQRKSVYTKFYC